MTTIPAYIATEEEFLNFYYENINLTYMYVLQNLRQEIDLIVFLGNIYNNFDLAEQVYGFARKPISVLYPFNIIKNISIDTFYSHIIHIGTLFLDLDYDIRDLQLIENKFFRNFSKNLFVIFSIFAFILIVFDIYKYQQNSIIKRNLIEKAHNLQIAYQNLTRQSALAQDIDYYIRYLNTISNLEKSSVLEFLTQIKEIFKIHKFEKVVLDKENKNLTIALNSQVYFPSLINASLFKSKLEDTLKNISRKYEDIKITKTILLDIDKFTVDINITIRKEIKDEN